MITPEVSEIFKAARKNVKFLADIKKADDDDKPNRYADSLTQAIVASAYYGWLVGKYGHQDWKQYL